MDSSVRVCKRGCVNVSVWVCVGVRMCGLECEAV